MFFPYGATALHGLGPPYYRGYTITLRHTTVGRTRMDERSAHRRDLYRTTHNTHNGQTSMPLVCRQLSSRTKMVLLESCLQTCMTYTIAECTVNKLLMIDRRTLRNM